MSSVETHSLFTTIEKVKEEKLCIELKNSVNMCME